MSSEPRPGMCHPGWLKDLKPESPCSSLDRNGRAGAILFVRHSRLAEVDSTIPCLLSESPVALDATSSSWHPRT